jgi:hypothetical protein
MWSHEHLVARAMRFIVKIFGVARRIVAFLDVLGFSSLVQTVAHDELVSIYSQLLTAAHQNTAESVFPDDHRKWDEDPFYAPEEIQTRRRANLVIASDSIIVYSNDVTGPPEDAETSRRQLNATLSVLAAVRGLLGAGFQNGLALRGGLAIGDLDEVGLAPDTVNPGNWTARFDGLVGMGLVIAYGLEGVCNWSGVILSDELVDWLDSVVLSRHEDGNMSLLGLCVTAGLLVQTRAPVKTRDANGQVTVTPEMRWAINWPWLHDHIDWNLREEQVVDAFTSFQRAADLGTEAKRDETVAFMRRAAEGSTATFKRLFSAHTR